MKALHMSNGRAKRLAESRSRGLHGPAAEAYKGRVMRDTKTTCQRVTKTVKYQRAIRTASQRVTGTWFRGSQGHGSNGHKGIVQRVRRHGSEGMGLTASQDMVQLDRRTWFGGSQGHGSDGHKGIGQRVKGEVFKITT